VLKFVCIPLAALRPLDLRHRWLMTVLVSFVGRADKCWPTLRQLAAESGHPLTWVQRNMAEMLALGYITREPHGKAFKYEIEPRFLPVSRRLRVHTIGTQTVPTIGTQTATVPTVMFSVSSSETEEDLKEYIPPFIPPKQGGKFRNRNGAGRNGAGRGLSAAELAPGGVPPEPWEQRCRSWVMGYRWNPLHGPEPGESGCGAPAELAQWALSERSGREAAE